MKFITIQNSFFFLLIGSISILFFWLINDFLLILFWAMVLGIVFFPLYKLLLKITKKREALSSLLTISVILVLIFLPIYLISNSVAKEAVSIYQNLATENNVTEYINFDSYENHFNNVSNILHIDPIEAKDKIISIIKNTAVTVSNEALNLGKYTLNTVIGFFIMIYLLFFIFKDGVKISKRISDILPIGNEREEKIFRKFISIVRAIFKGTLIVALVQGFLGGILLYIVGIKAFLLLTILMIFLSIIPAVGPTIVLLPTGIIFLLTENFWQGLLLIIGAILISGVDNILRPILVGNATAMHDALITISIFGGLAVFGITGFIIGPVIAGIFITVWLIFEEKYKEDLDKCG